MSSVALAITPGDTNAGSVVGTMLAALEDRSPEWTATDGTEAAIGAGAGRPRAAAEMIVAAPSHTGVSLAVDAPAWVRRACAPSLGRVAALGEVTSWGSVVELFLPLRGDSHAVAVIGSRGGVAYRSAMSSRPLFYTTGPDGSLLVATQIRGLLAVRPAEVSWPGLAAFLVPQLCDVTGTAWSRIHRVPPGHAVISWDGELDIRQVSQIDPVDTASVSRQELVAEFRRRLLRAVERNTHPPDGMLLSGGIDSSSLACAYAAITTEASRGYSITYDQELAACDERRFVDDVERATGMAVSRLPGNRLLPLVAAFPEGDEPEPWAYAARNWALLRHIAEDSTQAATTVLAGEGGDELLLGQVFTVADRLACGDTDGATAEIHTFPDPAGTGQVVKALLHGDYGRRGARMVRALGEIPPWLTDTYVTDTGIADRLAAGYPHLGEPGSMTINYSRGLLGDMGAAGRVQCGGWWEDMGRKAGIAITYPFLDPDLAALVWALPPELLRDKGVEKVVLREALSDELPASVVGRRDKADALALLHAGLGEKINVIRALADGGPLIDNGVIHGDKLLSGIDRYLAGDRSLAPALWATAAVDRWLTAHSSGQIGGPRG